MSEALKKISGEVAHKKSGSRKHLFILGAILALAFLLRFCGSWLPFFDDEPDVVVLAKTISLAPGRVRLPMHAADHGPLRLYLILPGSLILPGETFRFRFTHILLSTLHILLIYRLAKEVTSTAGALFAALFLALSQVHILFTKYATEELPHFFLVTLWLLVFWQGLKRDKAGLVLVTGVILGLGLLAKETIFFLVPTAFVFLLLSRQYRHWLWRKEFYLSLLLALLIMSPYLYWNWRHHWFAYRLASGYVVPFSFSGSAAELFLGWFTHLRGSDIVYGYDYMGPVAGMLATVGILMVTKEARNGLVKLILVAFWMVLAASFLFATGLPRHFAVALVPASVATGIFVGSLWDQGLAGPRGKRSLRSIRIFILLIFLAMAIFAARATAHFNHYWVSQSSIPLSSWGEHREIDLTTLSKAFIRLAQKHKATLAIFTDKSLDSTGAYFTAYSNIPSINTVPLFRWLEYKEEDFQRIVFFLTPKDSVRRLRDWAEENGYPSPEDIRDEIILKRKYDNLDLRLPARILIMSRKDLQPHPGAEDLVKLVYGK
jgi:hypothetical protein